MVIKVKKPPTISWSTLKVLCTHNVGDNRSFVFTDKHYPAW